MISGPGPLNPNSPGLVGTRHEAFLSHRELETSEMFPLQTRDPLVSQLSVKKP